MVILTQAMRGPGPLAYFRTIDQAIAESEGFTEAIVVDAEQADGPSLGTRFLFDGRGRPRVKPAVGAGSRVLAFAASVHWAIDPGRRCTVVSPFCRPGREFAW